jgi:hypothetical protein
MSSSDAEPRALHPTTGPLLLEIEGVLVPFEVYHDTHNGYSLQCDRCGRYVSVRSLRATGVLLSHRKGRRCNPNRRILEMERRISEEAKRALRTLRLV